MVLRIVSERTMIHLGWSAEFSATNVAEGRIQKSMSISVRMEFLIGTPVAETWSRFLKLNTPFIFCWTR